MTKIDIISGFLGAGKTTLIKKLLSEVFAGEKVVLIENEFGEIAIDGGFLKDAGIEIREMNQGCICCSLVGDFGTSLKEVMTTGRALPDELKQKLELHFRLCDIIDFYGTSEVGAISSINKLEWKTKNKSSGKPEFFVDVIIIGENREILGRLEVGEIAVKSKYGMQEYRFEQSLTMDSFVGEYICTGDMGYIDEDGYLFIIGRKTEVINRGGFYFYPSKIHSIFSFFQTGLGFIENIVMLLFTVLALLKKSINIAPIDKLVD